MKKQIRFMAAVSAAMILSLSFAVNAWAETGWVRSGSAWNYYNGDGTKAANQWVKTDKKLYWIEADGTMGVNKWIHDGEDWYYIDGSGEACSEWNEIDGKWYYFDKNSFVMVTDTTIDSWTVGKDGAWNGK